MDTDREPQLGLIIERRNLHAREASGGYSIAKHTKRKKCSHGSPKSDQEGRPKADLGIRALGGAEVEQYPVADEKPSTADGADDCDYYCDTDERERYGEQESDSLGKDLDALGFSDNRVIYEPMMSFDVMNVTCESFMSFGGAIVEDRTLGPGTTKVVKRRHYIMLIVVGKASPRCCNFRGGRRWGGETACIPTSERFMYENVFKFICSSSRNSHSGSDKGCFFNGVYITCKKIRKR
ncbi:hypothetical protein EV421DRAFT_1735419 [Armillaria borealis]|uniref:Uncharacterized protein n=1 Tax=Armillaria borealis TaxID=47425 RepID=A0AA39JKH8_9AGAR|nr:hypothetical protein EV421DRAFT_1735419 [Armillaria borealis]